MCLSLYIASDAELPNIEWDERNPAFNVSELLGHEEPVRKHFTKGNVAYVGSYEGCGCGFVIDPDEGEWDDDEQCEASVRRLGDYVEALLPSGTVELYYCWQGEENMGPDSRIEVTIDYFRGPRFWFEPKQFITVTGN